MHKGWRGFAGELRPAQTSASRYGVGVCLLTQRVQKVSPAPQFPRTALSIFFISFLITIWLHSGNQDRGGAYNYPLRGSADLGGILLGERGEGDVLGAMIGSLGLIL